MLTGAHPVIGIAVGEAEMRGAEPVYLVEHTTSISRFVNGTSLVNQHVPQPFALVLLGKTR